MRAFGWLRDQPDPRDLAFWRLAAQLRALPLLPSIVDLRLGCSPVEDQGPLGSCTANAVAGAVEYMERRAYDTYTDASRLFLYKRTRERMGLSGDSGATLRDTIKTLGDEGVPPEAVWPYDIARFEDEPTEAVKQAALAYRALEYYRCDPGGGRPDDTLSSVRQALAAGMPVVFGFTVFDSMLSRADGWVPLPSGVDRIRGKHAICAVGYDDASEALLFRNSWGGNWGQAGYGWLPYDYVRQDLANDFWVVVKQAWLASGRFGHGV